MRRDTLARVNRKLPIVALCAYLAYLATMIAQSSFVFAGRRWFCLFDDAMISMRYAQNLVAGDGLVFNRGERVEGFTNPLWCLMMAGAHLAVRDIAKVSLVVQVVSAAALIANLVLLWKLVGELAPQRPLLRWTVCGLTALFYPLNYFAVSGMEVGAVAALVTASMLSVAQILDEGRLRALPYWMLGLATLVRPDVVVIFATLAAGLFFYLPRERIRQMFFAAAWGAAFVLLPTLLRHAYYGTWVPNTYALKVQGIPAALRSWYGLQIFFDFAQRAWLVPIWAPLLAVTLTRRPAVRMAALLVTAQFGWSVYVGGDAWEGESIGANRFVATVAPLLVALLCIGLDSGLRWVLENLRGAPPQLLRAVPAVACALSCAAFIELDRADNPQIARRILLLEPAFFQEAQENLTRAAWTLREIADPDARIAANLAGIIPYFSGLRALDVLGKVDPHIAQLPMHAVRNADEFRAGHMKWDQHYTMVEQKPDIIAQVWKLDAAMIALLKESYLFDPASRFYLRRGSPHLHGR